jgi:hypothetical protein
MINSKNASLALLLFVAASGVLSEKVSYKGYKVYHIIPNTLSDVEYLKTLEGSGVSLLIEPVFIDKI